VPSNDDAAIEAPSSQLTEAAASAIRGAFAFTWTLACAAVAALQLGSSAIAILLFGWGRMTPESLALISAWGAIGAWSLLPQALIAVALTVLAVQGRMRLAVVAYASALLALVAFGLIAKRDGEWLMAALNVVLSGVAWILMARLNGSRSAWPLVAWRAMLVPVVALLVISLVAGVLQAGFPIQHGLAEVAVSVLGAIVVVATSWLANVELRTVLRR
jgi:hypothetical protein